MAPTGSFDDNGQPLFSPSTFATVPGLIQPRGAEEVALLSQGGAIASTHVGYIRPLTGISSGDWIEHDGKRYDIEGLPDAAGLGHHYELELRAVV